MSARLIAAVTLIVLAATGCGEREAPVRIGLLTNCATVWEPFWEPTIAAAELPLLARGAHRAGARPSEGIEGGEVGGRPVELVEGCSDGSTAGAVAVARRLVEDDGVDVLVGSLTPNEGIALRMYAHRRPRVTVVVVSSAQAATLQDPAPNVFRFGADSAQMMAGLGAHAYRELGWRRAALIGDATPFGYAQAAGFVAEFCALGGRVATRVWPPPETADFSALVRHLPARLDGVVVSGLVTVASDAGIVEALGARAAGILSAGPLPADLRTPAFRAYAESARREFPRQALMTHSFVVPYHDAMEAVARALDGVDGDLSADQRRFRRALAATAFDAPGGRVTLDDNRQAITTNHLVRLRPGAAAQRTIATVERVEQSFGGRFPVDGPVASRTSPACVAGTPPEWAG
jgi:branched-chain amino acid transport system substrate-binding protein